MLFGKFLMTTTAFLSLEDISDNLPRYDESVISVDMDEALQQAYEKLEEDIRSAMKAHRGNKSLMSILLNTLLLYPDHPYDYDEIWARAFDPQTKEYVKFLVTEPENLTREALYAKERALIADVKEELRQGRRCQVYATYTGEKDVTLRLEAVLRKPGASPMLFGKFLMTTTAFLSLEDISDNLPRYDESVISVDMSIPRFQIVRRLSSLRRIRQRTTAFSRSARSETSVSMPTL